MNRLEPAITKHLQEHPEGRTLREIAFGIDTAVEHVEHCLNSMRVIGRAQRDAGMRWHLRGAAAPKRPAVEAPSPLPTVPTAPAPNLKPAWHRNKTCSACHTEKRVNAFLAGDSICRMCRSKAGGGVGPGKPVDVTPREIVDAASRKLAEPPGQIPVDPPALWGFSEKAVEIPLPLKAMPSSVAVVLDMLERKREAIAEAIATIRSIYA